MVQLSYLLLLVLVDNEWSSSLIYCDKCCWIMNGPVDLSIVLSLSGQ